ncbi:WD repeat-containing protein 44 [Linum perenne]
MGKSVTIADGSVLPRMDRKRTLTMNWDAFGNHNEDDDRFFDCNRLSGAAPADLASSDSDDDDEFEESRASFSTSSSKTFRNYSFATAAAAAAAAARSPQYDIWMSAPGSITERRQRLLQGMGLAEEKAMVKMMSKDFSRAVSKKIAQVNAVAAAKAEKEETASSTTSTSTSTSSNDNELAIAIPSTVAEKSVSVTPKASVSSKHEHAPSQLPVMELVRSRSEGDIETFTSDKKRKEEVLGSVSKQRITRTTSLIIVSRGRVCSYSGYPESVRIPNKEEGDSQQSSNNGSHHRGASKSTIPNNGLGAFFLIKNLDTDKEFIVNEYDQDGMWNKVSDLQTGKKLTLEEFEKSVGHSPVVKELMRRENANDGSDRKLGGNNYFSKSLRMSKRRGAALVKSIKGVAHSMSMNGTKSERDLSYLPPVTVSDQKGGSSKISPAPSGWIKVRLTGKSHRELSALHLCQEIQAHEGSIWTLKFSSDARYLASAGEDKVIHVWEVQECEVLSLHDGHLTPLHPSFSTSASPGLGEACPMPSLKKKKKGSLSKKGSPIPEYVHVPETVFALSEKPICSFTGHLDDVLDLSWSGSQQFLSSSMDKTVRLWDMETKCCLKMFAHNDYVTCIQFNPMNDQYFLSGSLDNKIRVWSIPDRQLVDWIDLHEMVTAVCYTPDGQGALVGSHKGTCRMYSLEDHCKLNQTDQVEIQRKKCSGKKITGFQFSPGNPSEVMVTSADSRVRVMEGKDVVHKFRGFKNVNSQIAASFSLSGKHVICASEDSNVYIWKREEGRPGKGKHVTCRGYEAFQCKDVSVAIPWPGVVKGDPPPMPTTTTKSKSKRSGSATISFTNSPTKEDSSVSGKRTGDHSPTKEETSGSVSKKPPLPKKNNKDSSKDKEDKDGNSKEENGKDENCNSSAAEKESPEEEESKISRSESGVGESFSSAAKLEESPSTAMVTNLSISEGSSSSSSNQDMAWGLVIVAATSDGEIRAYQNFGLPRKMGRQSNLF